MEGLKGKGERSGKLYIPCPLMTLGILRIYFPSLEVMPSPTKLAVITTLLSWYLPPQPYSTQICIPPCSPHSPLPLHFFLVPFGSP